MPIVDRLLNSLIKFLKKKQKSRKKIKKPKRLPVIARRRGKKAAPRGNQKSSSAKTKKNSSKKPVPRKEKPPAREKKSIAAKAKTTRKFRGATKVSRLGNKKRKDVREKHKKNIGSHAGKGSQNAGKKRSKLVAHGKTEKDLWIGEVTHYFTRIQVVVLKMTAGTLSVGDSIRIRGNGTEFVQKVQSLQIESVDVKSARKGQLVGLKVSKQARPGDRVFKTK